MKTYSLVIAGKQTIPLEGERLTIGRAPTEIVRQISMPEVSTEYARLVQDQLYLFSKVVAPQHAILTREDDGGYAIEGCRSGSSTYLNGEPILSKTLLKIGDRLEIGPYEFFYTGESNQQSEIAREYSDAQGESSIPCRWCGYAVSITDSKCAHCGDLAPASGEELEVNCSPIDNGPDRVEETQAVLEQIAARHRSLDPTKTRKRYCPKCDEWVLSVEQQVQQNIHGSISFLFFWPWVFVWFILKSFPSYHCTTCKGGTFSSDAIPFRWLNGRRVVFGTIGCIVLGLMAPGFFEAREKQQAAMLFRDGAELMEAEDYEFALEKFNRVLELSPDSPEAYYNRGLIYVHLEKDEKAIEDFTSAIEHDISHGGNSLKGDALHQRAHCFDRLGQTEAALTGFTQSIDLEPDRAEFWRCRAKFHARQELIDEMINDFCEVARIEPDDGEHLKALGFLFYTNERHQEGVEFFTEIINSSHFHPSAYSHRAFARMSLNQHEMAISDFKEYLNFSPEDHIAMRELGRCYLMIESEAESLEFLDSAIEMSAEDSENYYLRAIAHANLGNREQALEDIQKAMSLVERSTDSYRVYFNLKEELQAMEKVPQLGVPANTL